MQQHLSAPQVCLLFSSTVLGLLDTLKQRRVEILGGWDRAVIKRGVIKKTDPAVEQIQEMEERFFAVSADLEKLCGKLTVNVMRRNGKPLSLVDDPARNFIHMIAGRMIDELQHFVDTAANGCEPGVTYLDGYNDAIDELEHLMFKHNMSRQAALDALREGHKRRNTLGEAA